MNSDRDANDSRRLLYKQPEITVAAGGIFAGNGNAL